MKNYGLLFDICMQEFNLKIGLKINLLPITKEFLQIHLAI